MIDICIYLLIQIRVWGRAEYIQDLVFAQEQTVAIHDYYEQYTGIADPMPKLGHYKPYLMSSCVHMYTRPLAKLSPYSGPSI
jgi:hypothetical protein